MEEGEAKWNRENKFFFIIFNTIVCDEKKIALSTNTVFSTHWWNKLVETIKLKSNFYGWNLSIFSFYLLLCLLFSTLHHSVHDFSHRKSVLVRSIELNDYNFVIIYVRLLGVYRYCFFSSIFFRFIFFYCVKFVTNSYYANNREKEKNNSWK